MSLPTITKLPMKPLPPPRLKQVGIYCRVSSTHVEQLASLSSQVSNLTKTVLYRPGWLLADIYIDIVSAATGSVRPEYNRLLQDCRDKKLDIVVTKSISRLGRDTLEFLSAIRELRGLGMGVLFEQHNIYTDSVDDEHAITILEAFVQAELESRSQNTHWGLECRAANGTCGLYKRRCFGYYTDSCGDLQIKADEAAVVCRIFEMYMNGESLVGIIKRLAGDGIRTPTGKDKWSKNAIDKLLSNEKYVGKVILFKTFSAKLLDPVAAPKTCPDKDQFGTYVGTECHPAIITEKVFDAVQAEKKRRTNIERDKGSTRRSSRRYSVKRDAHVGMLNSI